MTQHQSIFRCIYHCKKIMAFIVFMLLHYTALHNAVYPALSVCRTGRVSMLPTCSCHTNLPLKPYWLPRFLQKAAVSV